MYNEYERRNSGKWAVAFVKTELYYSKNTIYFYLER